MLWRGLRLRVEVQPTEVTYSLRNGVDGSTLSLRHHGEDVTVSCDKSVTLPVPPLPVKPPEVRQPAGRAPVPRAPRR